VVPRTWALTWLAGAHRETPAAMPEAWRERWADEAARYGQAPLPERFDDAPNAGLPYDGSQEASEQRAQMLASIHRSVVIPRLLVAAAEAGWKSPMQAAASGVGEAPEAPDGAPTIVTSVDADAWSRLSLAPRVIPPADASIAHGLVSAGLLASPPAIVSAAVVGSIVVGLAVSIPADPRDGSTELVALGVATSHRRQGIATALLRAHAAAGSTAVVTLAERDPIDPLPRDLRASIARRLFEGAGYEIAHADEVVRSIDPGAFRADFRSTVR
jgi:GNAT superfamily N-acetyltransferase